MDPDPQQGLVDREFPEVPKPLAAPELPVDRERPAVRLDPEVQPIRVPLREPIARANSA